MPIYARTLNTPQRRALERYEELSFREPIGQDDFDAGEISFAELWDLNIQKLHRVLADITSTDLTGTDT